jgi:disulfide bond formation protein DsbB
MRKLFIILLLGIMMALALVACGGGDSGSSEDESSTVSAGDPAKGEEQYNQVCIACHGPGGEGVEGLGKPFTTSEFLKTHNDEEMLAFVKTGRPISDPDNTTGVDMPPKGGNPALTDEQILDIIAFIRTLQ